MLTFVHVEKSWIPDENSLVFLWIIWYWAGSFSDFLWLSATSIWMWHLVKLVPLQQNDRMANLRFESFPWLAWCSHFKGPPQLGWIPSHWIPDENSLVFLWIIWYWAGSFSDFLWLSATSIWMSHLVKLVPLQQNDRMANLYIYIYIYIFLHTQHLPAGKFLQVQAMATSSVGPSVGPWGTAWARWRLTLWLRPREIWYNGC